MTYPADSVYSFTRRWGIRYQEHATLKKMKTIKKFQKQNFPSNGQVKFRGLPFIMLWMHFNTGSNLWGNSCPVSCVGLWGNNQTNTYDLLQQLTRLAPSDKDERFQGRIAFVIISLRTLLYTKHFIVRVLRTNYFHCWDYAVYCSKS